MLNATLGKRVRQSAGSCRRAGSLLAALVLGGCIAAPIHPPVQPPVETRFSDAESIEQFARAVDHRLELMRDVAAAKWIAGSPIQDAAREAAVLQQVAQRAQALGLDGPATQSLFAIQIRLAREVQQRWHARWTAEGQCAPCENLASLQATRDRIDAANTAQLAALYVAVPLRDTQASAFAAELRGALLPRGVADADVDGMRDAARAIRRTSGGDAVLDRIRATRVLRIATTGDYAPFSLEAEGRLTGADIELALELAAHMGVQPLFVRTSWPSLLEDLRSGRFDVAMSGISFTPERAAAGAYSVAYHEGGKTLLARCQDRERFDTPAELDRAGNRVIVNPGGTNERYVREHVRAAQIIVHPDNREVFAEIAAGRADVMVTDDVEAELQARRWPGQLCRTYPGTLTRGDKRILMARDPALQAAVDAWLQERIAAGEPARALERAMQEYVDATAGR